MPQRTPALRPRTVEQFRRAAELHRNGQLAAAEPLYLAVLKVRPAHVETLCLLGILRAQQARHDDAASLFRRAIALDPNALAAHVNLGNVLSAKGQFADAVASYDRALAIGGASVELLSSRGDACAALQLHAEALSSYDRALAIDPRQVEIWINRGNVLRALRRQNEALGSYDRALAVDPTSAEAHYNRGVLLGSLNRFADALASYDSACRLRPAFADAWCSRGVVLAGFARLEDALASLDRALAISPDLPAAHINRSNVLARLERQTEALASIDRALALAPRDAQAWYNRGNILRDLQHHQQALSSYARAIELQPDHADAHWNSANSRLLLGDFASGWPEFEWRWRRSNAPCRPFTDRAPLWLGEPDIAGKTILMFAESGFGDTLQFCRYVPLAEKRGGRVVLAVQPSLVRLLGSLAGHAQVISMYDEPPIVDLQCPLMSLPLAFATSLATVPADVPYLAPLPDCVARWRQRLGTPERPRVGIAWSGTAVDPRRSMPLALLLGALNGADCDFHVVQKQIPAADQPALRMPRLHDASADLRDFADTAALLSLMDLVITIDTAAAHLAGALGVRTWVMLPFRPEWRWLLERSDSPWYPTLRLFRQHRLDDWSGVLAAVAAQLAEWPQRNAALSAPNALSAGGNPA